MNIAKQMISAVTGIPQNMKPDFSSGLCSCCEDFNVCCCGAFCPGYLLCKQIAFTNGRHEHQMECWEKTCGILISITGLYWVGAIGIAIWEACVRKDIRKSLFIQPDDSCGETTRSLCCYPCAICQQERELRSMNLNPPTAVAFGR